MSARTEKKLRRLTRGEVAKVLPQLLPATAARTVLEMKKFAFGQRLRFAWWLLVGKGEWKGFGEVLEKASPAPKIEIRTYGEPDPRLPAEAAKVLSRQCRNTVKTVARNLKGSEK